MTPVKEKNNHEDRIILNPYKPYTEVLAELRIIISYSIIIRYN